MGVPEAPSKEATWQVLDRVTAQRKRLLNAGYKPIPANGKAPVIGGWQKAEPTEADIENWSRQYPQATNTGILTRNTPAVDIDVLDIDVANKLQDLLWQTIGANGHAMVRFGQAPKRAILFQTDQTYAKISTPVFTSPDQRKHRVEVLCDGQQIITHGIHPNTGNSYLWQGGEPGIVQRDDLPFLSPTLAAEYIAKASELMDASGWTHKGGEAADERVRTVPDMHFDALYGDREQKYACKALEGCASELAITMTGERNDKLNKFAFRLGTMAANGWIDRNEVSNRLLDAARACGYVADDGEEAARQTIKSGLDAGERKPHPKLEERNPVGTEAWRTASATAHSVAENERQPRGRNAETGTWDEPDRGLLDDRRGELPEFPVAALPASLHEWLLRAARGAGVTAGHVAVPLLGIASSLMGTARRVRASRSWSEPLSTWVAVIGFSGTGKTPGLDVTRRVLSLIERERKHKIAELQREHETRAEKAKAGRKKWEKAVSDAVENNLPPPPKPPSAMEPGPFVAPRLCVSDSTIERIAVLLEVRPQGMAFVADELARLFLNMQRYSNGQDNEFWLEAWNGKNFIVERQGRPPVVVDHLLVGVTGGFQPDKLARAFEGDDDGMYARFLFAWPEEPPHMPLSNEVTEIEPEIQNALTRIVNLPAEEDGVFAPRTVELSPEAVAAFETFRTFLAKLKPELDGREREWVAKGGTHVLRLSGTLAYLDWAMVGGTEPQAISEQYVEAAVRLWREYFWPHGRAALRQLGFTETHTNARRILRWLAKNRPEEVSLLDIRREALGRRLDAEQTRILLDSLVRAGWLKLVTTRRLAARSTVGMSTHSSSLGPPCQKGQKGRKEGWPVIRATLSDLADLSPIGARKQYRPRHRPACEPAMAASPLLQHGCTVDTRNDDGSRSGLLAQTFELLVERR